MKSLVWVVSELYYPEESATGYLLTRIAEGLAKQYQVRVLCGQPNYLSRGVRAPVTEVRNGVDIRRCPSTTWNKDILLFRLFNLVTISFSIFWEGVCNFRRRDVVLVVTNPPSLPFITVLACRVRGAKCLLLIHDVFPEALVAAGLVKPDALLTRMIGRITSLLYRSVERVVVLGRDMRDVVLKTKTVSDRRVVVIPNWADIDIVWPTPKKENTLLSELGLADKFVLEYAGNMGRTHGLETLVESAASLAEDKTTHFLFVGSGAKKKWVEQESERRKLENITVLPNKPREEQIVFLNACDTAIISFVPGMAGISVPSRMYNVLAAGKPILAVADESSELARVVREEGVGWVVSPNRPGEIVAAIRAAQANGSLVEEMGKRGRAAATEKYSFEKAIDVYCKIIEEVASENPVKAV
jgi:glycosyltransferase involved in cell wall biosynthesis